MMGMTRAVWVGQERVWVGRDLPGLIARTASDYNTLHAAGVRLRFSL